MLQRTNGYRGSFGWSGKTSDGETGVTRRGGSQGKVSGREFQREGAVSAKVCAGKGLADPRDTKRPGAAAAQHEREWSEEN